MSIDIYMYAEARRNGAWTLCVLAEPLGDGEHGWLDRKAIYLGEQNRENVPLARALVAAGRTPQSWGDENLAGRELPDDLSSELRTLISTREELEWMCNYASWLLLQEILEIRLHERMTETRGLVDAEQYVLFRRAGRPESFAPSVAAQPVTQAGPSGWMDTVRHVFGRRPRPASQPQIVSSSEMDQLVADGHFSTGAVTEIAYQTPTAEYCQVFLNQTLPLLRTFGNPDDVRIVYWF